MTITKNVRTASIVRLPGIAIAGMASLLFLAGCTQGPDNQAPQIMPTQPLAVKTPPPSYPIELACDNIGGQVGLIMKIGADGMPKNIRVEDGSGHPQLDQAAAEAVKAWVFQPGTSRGQPVETDLRVPVTFTPQDMDSDECVRHEDQAPLQE
ncbi:MAG: energy transducer TonB [Lysobacter sp.]